MSDRKNSSELLDPKQAAEFLGMTEGTLRVWRSTHRGPAYVKQGHRVYYEQAALERFQEERTTRHGG